MLNAELPGTMVLIVDISTGSISYANKAACTYYQYSQIQLTNLSVTSIDSFLTEDVLADIAKSASRNFYSYHRLADGTLAHVQIEAQSLDLSDPSQQLLLLIRAADTLPTEAGNLADIMLSSISDLVVLLDLNHRVIWANQPALDVLDEDNSSVTNTLCYELWHQRQAPCEPCPAKLASINQQPVLEEISTPDGRNWLCKAFPIQDAAGEVYAVLEVVTNISDLTATKQELFEANRQLAEQNKALDAALQESQRLGELLSQAKQQLEFIFTSIGDGIIVTDTAGKVTMMNAAAQNWTGWGEEAYGEPLAKVFNIVNEYTRARVDNPVEKVLATGKIQGLANHTVLISKVGTERAIADAAAPVMSNRGEILGVVLIFRDVSLERETNRQLEESESRYKTLFENTGTATVMLVEDGSIVLCNEQMAELTRINQQELMGMSIFDLIHPDDVALTLENHRRRRQSLRAPQNYSFRMVDKEGKTKIVSAYVTMITGTKTSIVALVDITEQEKNRQMLYEYGQRYESLFAENSSVMLLIDPEDGRIVDANEAAQQFYGYGVAKIRNMYIFDLSTLSKSAVQEEMSKVLEEQRKQFIFQHKLSDGSVRDVEVYSGPIDIAGQKLLYSIIHDITQRRLAEERLANTLEAVIRTLGSIIDIKDPYTAGHARRVAQLAAAVGQELNLPNSHVDSLNKAAFLHDIGKINTPSEILNKPGKISDLDFEIIKEHVRDGYEVLKQIDFNRPIAQIVLQHHERLDGSGYPQGLLSENILLEAKILAVADVVEAMSSHRPYRPALGIDAALDEILQLRGIKYDERVVDATVKLFTADGFEFKQE